MAHTWVEQTDAGYDADIARHTYADDAYTGAVRDKAVKAAEAMPDPVAQAEPKDPDAKIEIKTRTDHGQYGVYLRRRSQGEHPANFRERAALTRYPMHFFGIVAEFVGAIGEVEDEAERSWGVLGDPEEDDTPMAALFDDADGAGTNWPVWWTESAVLLCTVHEHFYAVIPPVANGGLPRLHLIERPRVLRTRYALGQLVEAIVYEDVDTTQSLRDEATARREYIHYTTEGWTRYVVEEGEAVPATDPLTGAPLAGIWSQPFVSRHGAPRIPLGKAALPLRFPVGYRTAQANVDLYNFFSDVRNLIRVANHPTLKGLGMTQQEFLTTIDERKRGANVMFGDWSYISPDPANAQAGYEIYRQEVGDFYVTALQMYNDAPKVKTARQTEEDSRARTAFLTTLSNGLDEAENDALHLAAQIVAPSTPSQWAEASVRRKKRFRPIDPDELRQRRSEGIRAWLDMNFTTKTALVEGGGYAEEEADEILAADAAALGTNGVLEL